MSGAGVHLRMLGSTELRRDGNELNAFLAGSKRLGLLAYLVIARPRGFQRRDTLLPLFWPERGQKNARNALSNMLYQIRQELGKNVITNRGAEEIGVQRDRLSCDVIAFEEAFDQGNQKRAVDLYRGDLLSGFYIPHAAPAFDDWLAQARERLQRRYQNALETLATDAEERGASHEAVTWWRKRVRKDAHNSRAVRRLMEALLATGNRAQALQAAEVHSRHLQDEIGVPPEESMREFVEQVRTTTDRRPFPRGEGPRSISISPSPGTDLQIPDRENPSIAVLPLKPLGSEAASSYAKDFQEDLVARLMAASTLRVLPCPVVRGAERVGKTAAEAGTALNVLWVLSGELQTTRSQLQVNVRLINTNSNQEAWATSYHQTLTAESLFQIQIDVTKQITTTLKGKSISEEENPTERPPNPNLTAYRLYAQGRAGVDERTEEGIRRGLDCFQGALAEDSDYALAWSGLAEALLLLEFYGYERPSHASTPMEAAQRAVELDPELGEARASLGILYAIRRAGPKALRELERAVELVPSHAEAHIWLGWVQLCLGRRKQGLPSAQRAVALSPLAPAFRAYLAEIALANGKTGQALKEARRAREIQPEYGLAHYLEGLVLSHQDRPVAATSAFQRALSEVRPDGTPMHTEIRAALATTHARAGDRDRTEDLLHDIDEARDPFSVGLVRSALGDREVAFTAFEQVHDWGSFETEHLRYFFPEVLGPIREHPRYKKLIRRVNESWGLGPDGSLRRKTGSAEASPSEE